MPIDPLEAPVGYRAAPELTLYSRSFSDEACTGCVFRKPMECNRPTKLGDPKDVSCSGGNRNDNTDVIFVLAPKTPTRRL